MRYRSGNEDTPMKILFKANRWLVFIPILSLLGLAVTPSASVAQQPSGMDLPDDAPVTTKHQVTVGGRTLQYTARAGYLSLRTDFRETKARIFYVSYTLDRGNDRTPRPLTFAWNGGPGSPASTIHLGMVGPRRAKTMDEYETQPPPFQLVDNSDTWLAFSDLVLVDPVGTGYSYATKPEYLREFWSTIGDIDSNGGVHQTLSDSLRRS
jgi:carboxypeptidase C (cathepsin A)